MANPHKNYTFGNRFQKFLEKIVNFAKTARNSSQIDTGPDGIFDGEKGELVSKYKENIFYRKNDSNKFIRLSDEYSELVEKNKYVLSQGVNEKATWVKSSHLGSTTWQFCGYFSPFSSIGTSECCTTSSYDSGSV